MRLCRPLVVLSGAFVMVAVTTVAAQRGSPRESPSALAQTPPMGWNSWNHFRLNITDAIIRTQAAAMVTAGLKAAGYAYVVIDGGWEGYHDSQGVFHSDPERFPDMRALCDYVHGLGLKVGIHTSPGPKTCSGREASYGHEEQDARTFADWGIDFVKYDWCSAGTVYQADHMRAAYKKMSDALSATGRPMVYSLCQYGMQDVWKWGGSVGGQMWRTTGDIQSNYFNMIAIGFSQNGLEQYAGPGRWNDPDMLEIGNGMKPDEERTHMTLWCLLAAPLFAGNDLTAMPVASRDILTNAEAIAIDQDAAGVQGHRVWQEGPIQVWTKTLSSGAAAIGIFNTNARPMDAAIPLREIGLPDAVQARDLWLHADLGTLRGIFRTSVPGHGTVFLRVGP